MAVYFDLKQMVTLASTGQPHVRKHLQKCDRMTEKQAEVLLHVIGSEFRNAVSTRRVSRQCINRA